MQAQIIAERTVIVHDDALGIDRQVAGGQPVPPDLVDAYRAEIGAKVDTSEENDEQTTSRGRKSAAKD